jgi:hypothetical protein
LQTQLEAKGISFIGLGKYEVFSFGDGNGLFKHPVYRGFYLHSQNGYKHHLSMMHSSVTNDASTVGRFVTSTTTTFDTVDLQQKFLVEIYHG